MTIEEIQQEIAEDFALFDNWEDKYAYLIELGKQLPPMPEELKTEDKLVKGCQSKVWLHAYMKDGKLYFLADSDALIVKGIVSLLIKVLSGHKPEEIARANLHLIEDIGLKQHLSMTRANGLVSMIKHMKAYAEAVNSQP
ncbi:cysteine desulfuration protein SufE [Thermonema lapsum]|uniref:Cysteine desulfuration protein SufE n=1 Tax=Thermonema lapsum TaxID=28195 RepID=A0A846MS21_9BACT|nr:SufE family protein [Thermonema lapsum]NIK74057.1 cysteine desulfuration protein SufE [Thermonema lapsum]